MISAQVIQTTEKQPAKPRRSNKPPIVKASVVAKRFNGESISKIARDLNITRPTVYAILDETDVDRAMADGRMGTLKRIPEALATLDVRLEKNSESAAIWLLDKCFDNQQPTGKRMAGDVTLNQTLQVLLRPESADSQNLKSQVINEIEIKPEK